MRRVVLFLLTLFLLSFTNKDRSGTGKTIYISPESELFIKGTSNVNKFDCVYDVKQIKNPIRVQFTQKGDEVHFQNAKLILNSTCFDCGGRAINKDFKSILKSDAYSHIVLNLVELRNTSDPKKVNALLNIEIAGISKPYEMVANVLHDEGYRLTGKLKLNINDFELEPPKKMMGLIIVSEIIEINFQMILEEWW